MGCEYCGKDTVYRCSSCGKLLCPEHTQLRPACPSCIKKEHVSYTVHEVMTDKEKSQIREFVRRFWGEEEQLTFDRRFMITDLQVYTAKVEGNVIGFISFTEEEDVILIVALGILPQYQSSGIGKALVGQVEYQAKEMKKKILLVSASNDDLPALAFYQFLGFQIYEVKQNIIAEKHGAVLKGIGGLPIRDEVRMRKKLS